MKIMYVSAEVAPFAKAGGLGDVLGALPVAVERQGNECAIFTPLYGNINCAEYNIVDIPNSSLKLRFSTAEYRFNLKMCKLPNSNINVFFIESKKYFSSFRAIYPARMNPRYEQEKYVVFAKAVLEYAKLLNFKPDVVHLNDWHTVVLGAYLKTVYNKDEFYKNAKVAFSIHNLAYQGTYYDDILDFAQLPKNLSEPVDDRNVRNIRIVNWLKNAIKLSDILFTVSPKYAEEIQGSEFGCGLNYELSKRRKDIKGILNGLDDEIFNPLTDENLVKNYDFSNHEDKIHSKKEICKMFKIKDVEKPLIAVIARLVEQKGFDLIIQAVDDLKELDANFIIFGSGDRYYADFFEKLNQKNINIKANTHYDEGLAHKIFAASDMLLMPSHFEPCGITQMIAMKYGSIPLVRAVGGLENTVVGYPLNGANGFKFWRYEKDDMMICIRMALEVYKDKKTFTALIKNAMESDFSWDKSAKLYCEAYKKAIPVAR